MKLRKQVLILLLCFLLARFTAQAESFGTTAQSNEQVPEQSQRGALLSHFSTLTRPHVDGNILPHEIILLDFSCEGQTAPP